MHLLLLLAGVALAGAGVAMLRYAVPVEDAAGTALFISGVVATVGAFIMVGLAVAVRNLGRIAERLEIQPLPLPPMAAVEREDPAPRPVRPPPAAPRTGAARPSLLGWLGRGSTAPAPVRAQSPSTPPAATPPAPTPQADLAPLTRVPEPPPPPVGPPARPAATPSAAANTVYRSGVIDGMAYTLFMDGSIQAELPQGMVKFASVDELQKYLLDKR